MPVLVDMRRKKDELPAASAWPFERRCPECGKKFCVPVTETWIFRERNVLLCSWGCVRAREEKRRQRAISEAAKRRKKLTPAQKEGLVRRLVYRGLTDEEIGRETGISTQLAHYYRRKIEDESEK